MSGVTKHIFEHDIQDILSMWNVQLKTIIPLLKKEYDENQIIFLLKKFYPYEWKSVEEKYKYYQIKDDNLIKRFGKARYKMKRPRQLLLLSSMYKEIMSLEFRKKHRLNYSDIERIKAEEILKKKRMSKIEKIDKKIQESLKRTQQITPDFINQLIGLYERKTTTQKDKMYILQELKKYYSSSIIQFFFKLNDIELNKQLRWEAFYHLQSFNYHPRARSQKYMQIHSKNKKRRKFLREIYPNQKFDILQTPQELEYRINNSAEQKIKTYDYFISHSSKDFLLVQKLINYENTDGKNVFCDWINDVDYLKRDLLCNATLKVIEHRLDQSNKLIFVSSKNSVESIWCKYELNYFYNLKRPIYYITAEGIRKGDFEILPISNPWFLDINYQDLLKLN